MELDSFSDWKAKLPKRFVGRKLNFEFGGSGFREKAWFEVAVVAASSAAVVVVAVGFEEGESDAVWLRSR